MQAVLDAPARAVHQPVRGASAGIRGEGALEVRSSLPLLGQKDLADSIVERLNKAVNVALADGETRKRLLTAYIEPQPMSPKELAAWLDREHDRLGGMIQRLGIKADGA